MSLPPALDPMRREFAQQLAAAKFHAAEALSDEADDWRRSQAQVYVHLAIADSVTQWVAAEAEAPDPS